MRHPQIKSPAGHLIDQCGAGMFGVGQDQRAEPVGVENAGGQIEQIGGGLADGEGGRAGGETHGLTSVGIQKKVARTLTGF